MVAVTIRFLRALSFLLALGASLAVAAPATAREVRIGVLAFRSVEQTERQWAPLAAYLDGRVPGHRFKVVPMLVDAVENNVRAGWVDFILVNPEPYVALAARYRLAALATLTPLAGERPASRFGGVIFVRAERAELAAFGDIEGRRVAAATNKSFAGYLAQKWALGKHGVELDRATMLFTGLPQDRVVRAVLGGQADFGFVRTGLIEAMQGEGRLKAGQLRVLEVPHDADFGLALSTDLYPEWPFAALDHVPEALAKAVALALLNLDAAHPAARVAGIHGFAPPGNYAAIEALLLRLREHPDRLAAFGPAEVAQKYAGPAAFAAAALLAVAVLALYFMRRQNRRLTAALAETRRLAQREELLDSLSEGVYGVDPAGRCTFINEAALKLLGYRAADLLGCNPHAIIHHHHPDGRNYPAAECPVHRTLHDGEPREGEEVFFQRDGKAFPVRFGVKAVLREGAITGAVVAFQDIRAEKAAAERIRDLALHDPLTGLPNRRLLWDRLELELARAGREGQRVGVLFIDLDGFKEINDRRGHEAGDAVLVNLAARLRDGVRAADTVARIGGDEFVVVLVGFFEADHAGAVADKLLSTVAEPVSAGEPGALTASVGIALFPDHGGDATTLVHHADLAMYEAKRAGKNRWAASRAAAPRRA